MIGTNQYNLTWNNFEQLHADKKRAFENLSFALFARELCQNGVILHSDYNHPGVEVAPVLAKDGKTRISFQAKHFDKAIGYSQIKKSVNEVAILYKGKLDVVYLYCNQDITETCDSYKEIVNILAEAGIKIKLVTGQTILDQAMNYQPVLACYFGLDSLDDNWFKRNINLSLANLGNRYNSIFNVDTEVQRSFSLFLREPAGVLEVNAKKENLINDIKTLMCRCDRKYKTELGEILKAAKLLVDVDIKSISIGLDWKKCLENKCGDVFAKLKVKLAEIQNEVTRGVYNDSEYEKLKNEEFIIERILALVACLEFSKTETTMINCKTAIITGEMGTGKSQLLATAAKRIVDSGRPALLLLGQTFISDEGVEKQIMCNLEGVSFEQSFESLISVMDEKARLIDEDAIIFIDAINESRDKEVWKSGINRIIATLEQYIHVKLVISLRTGFEELTLSQSVLDKIESGEIAKIKHTGLVDESPGKIYEFLSYRGIPFSPEYYIRSEMTNPLFLTWFCNTYTGEEQGLLTLIDRVLKQADYEGAKSAGLSEAVGILKPLIYEMLDITTNGNITKHDLLGLTVWNIYGVSNKIEYLNAIERAGVLVSFAIGSEENYYIGYNLLEDYFKAAKIVENEVDKGKIIERCERTLFELDDEGHINKYGNESVFSMVVSLYAMKYDDELVEVLDKVKNDIDKKYLKEAYYSSFIWRSSRITYDSFFKILRQYPVAHRRVWEVFIENSVKEKSELNALGLTKLLNGYPMNKRDFLWTTAINSFDENDRIISLAYYIEAGNTLAGISENKAYLLAIIYTWMLSSSNRILRDRVSKAIIEILKEYFKICKRLLELFKEVNDPYIIQRLYGVVFGAVMRRKNEDKAVFKDLALWVYKEIFDKEMVYPDILLRDYARLIVERFAVEYPSDLDGMQLPKIRPPYKSVPIPVAEEVDYSANQYSDLWTLLYSMKFNMDVKGIGMYGDFGRYVFQSALDSFVDLNVANVYYYSMHYILNDLGYNKGWFGEYDKRISEVDRHHVKRVERIGKKYQWITMYNILARVSDSYKIKSEDWSGKMGVIYNGPWDPYVRDFDPTLNVRIKVNNGLPILSVPIYGEESFCNKNFSENDANQWVVEDDKMFQDFPQRFFHTDENGREWVSLYIYQENKLRLEEEDGSGFGFPKGEQHIWTIATMYMMTCGKTECKMPISLEEELSGQNLNGMQQCYSLLLREYAWSPGYNNLVRNILDDDEKGFGIFSAALNFKWEEEYDASQETTASFAIPAGQIIKEMQLYEKDVDGIYYRNEDVVAFDLSLVGNEHIELVMRKDVLNEYIVISGVKAFWKVVGEKQFFMENLNQKHQRREGLFIYDNNEIKGSINAV